MDEEGSKETSEPFFIIYQALTVELELLQLLHTNVTLPHSFGQNVTCVTLIRYLAFRADFSCFNSSLPQCHYI